MARRIGGRSGGPFGVDLRGPKNTIGAGQPTQAAGGSYRTQKKYLFRKINLKREMLIGRNDHRAHLEMFQRVWAVAAD